MHITLFIFILFFFVSSSNVWNYSNKLMEIIFNEFYSVTISVHMTSSNFKSKLQRAKPLNICQKKLGNSLLFFF